MARRFKQVRRHAEVNRLIAVECSQQLAGRFEFEEARFVHIARLENARRKRVERKHQIPDGPEIESVDDCRHQLALHKGPYQFAEGQTLGDFQQPTETAGATRVVRGTNVVFALSKRSEETRNKEQAQDLRE